METALLINALLLIAGFVMILAEIFLGIDSMFDLVLSGFSLVIGGSIGILSGSWIVGLVLSIVLLVAYWILGRRYVHSRLAVNQIPSNVDRLLGMKVEVIRRNEVSNRITVNIDGEEWTGECDEHCEVGDRVEVLKIDGAILKLRKA